MRDLDHHDTPGLGRKVEPELPVAQQPTGAWTPITSQPGYERSTDGAVRKAEPPSQQSGFGAWYFGNSDEDNA